MQMGELAQLEAQLRKEADDIQQIYSSAVLPMLVAMLAEGAQAIPAVETPETETTVHTTEPEHGQLTFLRSPFATAHIAIGVNAHALISLIPYPTTAGIARLAQPAASETRYGR